MKTTLYTSYDCIIEFENEKLSLSKNEHISFDNCPSQIIVFPKNKSPKFSFSVDNASPSQFCRTIEKDDKLLIFLIDGFLQEGVDIFSFMQNEEKNYVKFSKTKVVFSSTSHEKEIYFPSPATLISQGNFKHIAYVCFHCNNEEHLVMYNTVNHKTKMFHGDHFNFTENGFILTKENNAFYKKIEKDFIVDNDGLKCKSKTFVKKDVSNELLLVNFFNSLKLQDYQSSYDMLSLSLKDKISATDLQKYFGDISYFFPLDQSTCFVVSNGDNIMYELTIENNKIVEISDSKK